MAVAAILSRTPLVMMEQNTRPGLVNRLLSRFARKICVGFGETSAFFTRGKVEVTGNPVRFVFFPQVMDKVRVPLQILVLGGSSFAHCLNLGVLNAFNIWVKTVINLKFVLLTGVADVGILSVGFQQ